MAMLEEDSRIHSGDTVPEISYQNQIVSNLTWETKEIEEVQSLNFLLMAGCSEEQALSPRQPPIPPAAAEERPGVTDSGCLAPGLGWASSPL